METIKFCECEEQEIDLEKSHYVFYTCKNCGDAVKRKEDICVYYMTSRYCGKAEENNTPMKCPLDGDFSECKSGYGEEVEVDES